MLIWKKFGAIFVHCMQGVQATILGTVAFNLCTSKLVFQNLLKPYYSNRMDVMGLLKHFLCSSN